MSGAPPLTASVSPQLPTAIPAPLPLLLLLLLHQWGPVLRCAPRSPPAPSSLAPLSHCLFFTLTIGGIYAAGGSGYPDCAGHPLTVTAERRGTVTPEPPSWVTVTGINGMELLRVPAPQIPLGEWLRGNWRLWAVLEGWGEILRWLIGVEPYLWVMSPAKSSGHKTPWGCHDLEICALL